MQRPTTRLSPADRDPARHRASLAIVGLGSAAGMTLRALRDRTDVQVVAAVEPLGRALPDLPDAARVVRHIEELPVVDLVVVATPTPTHVVVCESLLQHGRVLSTLMCEKPVALRVHDVERLHDAAGRRGIDFRALLHYAFAPEVLWLADRIDELGPVESACSRFEDPYGRALEARTAVLHSSWVDSGINALTVLDRLVRLRAIEHATSTGVTESKIGVAFSSGDSLGCATVVTRWGEDATVKRTTLSLHGGRTVELDHLVGTCSLDGVVVYRGPTPASQARYDSMLCAHLDDSRWVHSRSDILVLHRLLDDGSASFGVVDR